MTETQLSLTQIQYYKLLKSDVPFLKTDLSRNCESPTAKGSRGFSKAWSIIYLNCMPVMPLLLQVSFLFTLFYAFFLQSLSELSSLQGLEEDHTFQKEVALKTLVYKAYRWVSPWWLLMYGPDSTWYHDLFLVIQSQVVSAKFRWKWGIHFFLIGSHLNTRNKAMCACLHVLSV